MMLNVDAKIAMLSLYSWEYCIILELAKLVSMSKKEDKKAYSLSLSLPPSLV